MIVFETQEDFTEAVMQVVKERLGIALNVRMVSDGDYYNPGRVPEVDITLKDYKTGEGFLQVADRAW